MGGESGLKATVTMVMFAVVSTCLMAASGCGTSTLKLGTTTAIQRSGLLTKINDDFENKYGCRVEVTAKASSAQVLRLGQAGQADLLLVNSRDGVKSLVQKRLGVEDKDILYADLVVVGPKSDPAGIRGLDCPGKSSMKISQAKATYIARGDSSDLDKRIMGYWNKIKVDPVGQPWFVVTKKPTADSLQVASDKQGYMIVDRLSWLENRNGLDLEVLVQGCTMLFDQYTAVVVNPVTHPDKDLNTTGAEQYVTYLSSPTVQKEIASYRKLGATLFVANSPKGGQTIIPATKPMPTPYTTTSPTP